MLISLGMATVWALVACLVHARERIVARARVGRVLHAERGSLLARVLFLMVGSGVLGFVLLGCLGILATGAWAHAGIWILSAALVPLSLAAVVLARPAGGRACGARGVRSGSWSHAYGDLEEWRLTGDHLRFRVGAVWRAAALPRGLHPEVREVLVALVGERESRFRE